MSEKVAVISGGTSGIGKSLVLLLIKNGIKVVTFSRKKSNINLLLKDFQEYKKNLICYQGDVSKEKDVKRITKSVKSKFKRID